MRHEFTASRVPVFKFQRGGPEEGEIYVFPPTAKAKFRVVIPVMYEDGMKPMMVGQARLTRDGDTIYADITLMSLIANPKEALSMMRKLRPVLSIRVDKLTRERIKAFTIEKVSLTFDPKAAGGKEPLGDKLTQIPDRREMH